MLIVEDDPASAKLLAVALGSEGCDVAVVGSAEEARALVPTLRPQVIVVDLILPMESGLALAQSLQAAPETSEIVLIAVSAANGRAVEEAVRDAGFSAYSRKPIDPLEFPSLVLAHLREGT